MQVRKDAEYSPSTMLSHGRIRFLIPEFHLVFERQAPSESDSQYRYALSDSVQPRSQSYV